MSINSSWLVHSGKSRTLDAYLHFGIVIGRRQWIVLPARLLRGSRLLETGRQSLILIDEDQRYRQSHILVDDSGTARLAMAGRSSVMAIPGTEIAGHIQSVVDGDFDDYGYTAPEIALPEEFGNVDNVLATKEADVYGMGMIAYEVSSHCLVFIQPEG